MLGPTRSCAGPASKGHLMGKFLGGYSADELNLFNSLGRPLGRQATAEHAQSHLLNALPHVKFQKRLGGLAGPSVGQLCRQVSSSAGRGATKCGERAGRGPEVPELRAKFSTLRTPSPIMCFSYYKQPVVGNSGPTCLEMLLHSRGQILSSSAIVCHPWTLALPTAADCTVS